MTLLMCKPDFYSVDYSINPWMKYQVGNADVELAHDQWTALYNNLSQVTKVELMDGIAGLPDMVFTANAGVVYNQYFFPSRFRYVERRAEQEYFQQWFDAHGFAKPRLPFFVYEETWFEGAGDAIYDSVRDVVWCGYGFRSAESACSFLQEHLDPVSLQLHDPRFYHLDTCFCPLTSGHILYYPHAFSLESQNKIIKIVPKEFLIPVSTEEALNFSCNAAEAANFVFANHFSQRLRVKLSSIGYTAITNPLSEFIKSGGGAKCLTLDIGK